MAWLPSILPGFFAPDLGLTTRNALLESPASVACPEVNSESTAPVACLEVNSVDTPPWLPGSHVPTELTSCSQKRPNGDQQGQLPPKKLRVRVGCDFAGIDNASRACRMAGLEPDLIFASECNKSLQKILDLQGPPGTMYADVHQRVNHTAGNVDVLVTSPDCQPYSTIGLRKGANYP